MRRSIAQDRGEVEDDVASFSLEEIGRHRTPQDCWLLVQGKVYDVSAWIPQHPGGSLIYLKAGGDCSQLFDAYHPLSARCGPTTAIDMLFVTSDHSSDCHSWKGRRVSPVQKVSRAFDYLQALRLKDLARQAVHVASYRQGILLCCPEPMHRHADVYSTSTTQCMGNTLA